MPTGPLHSCLIAFWESLDSNHNLVNGTFCISDWSAPKRGGRESTDDGRPTTIGDQPRSSTPGAYVMNVELLLIPNGTSISDTTAGMT